MASGAHSSMPIWHSRAALQPYEAICAEMEACAKSIQAGMDREQIWMFEHAPVFTAGTSARPEDLLAAGTIPTIQTGRGGEWTYHGPGQLVVWPMLRLAERGQDIRAYVRALEGWIIDILACFSISGMRREGLPGVWVQRTDIGAPDRLDKIAAIGVRVSKWVSMHGLAINLEPDLGAFQQIIPCGVTDGGTTSFADLGYMVSRAELEMAVQDCFAAHFGPEGSLAIR